MAATIPAMAATAPAIIPISPALPMPPAVMAVAGADGGGGDECISGDGADGGGGDECISGDGGGDGDEIAGDGDDADCPQHWYA